MTSFTLTREQVRELDRRASERFGVPSIVLMENAGRGCAELLMRLNPDRQPTVILCGPGNNGGDGFVIARHLDNHGWPVAVACICPLGNFRGDAATNFHATCEAMPDRVVGPLDIQPDLPPRLPQILAEAGWIVDSLFGTGLSRSLGPPYDTVIEMVNAARKPVLAVDLPSGLDCDTGDPLGPCVRAAHTATFVALKRGFLNPRSQGWTGAVHVIGIGAPRKLIEEYRRS